MAGERWREIRAGNFLPSVPYTGDMCGKIFSEEVGGVMCGKIFAEEVGAALN